MDLKAENLLGILPRITKWRDVVTLLEYFSLHNKYDWLFRGVTDADAHGTLIPKVGRPGTRATKENLKDRVPYRVQDELAVFEMFCRQARPFLPSIPRNELEWLAIAQHFGLPTRLLDWTDMFLPAVWFAVEKGGSGKPDAALWVTKEVPAISPKATSMEVLDTDNFKEPAVFRPPHIDGRIVAQGSVLMLCPKPERDLSLKGELKFLKKITIDGDAQFEIKKRLNACGINRRQLFPDLSGLATHLSWLYKHDWLAGYRR